MEKFKAGNYINQGYYKSFQPEPIHRKWNLSDMNVLQILSEADRHLGKLDMYSEYVDIDLYIRMHIAKEATQSSKIEGTQTNMEEAFLKKEEVHIEKRDDWEEVQNYITAMNEAVKLLHALPFSSRLIKQTHKILLQGVRGEKKSPGEYRTSQNWIGGAKISDAVFIPPVHTSLAELMGDFEKFANDQITPIPYLIKIAILHYQFETIHPFLDGNGRVGRLLITLYLVDMKILKRPILYLSDFFEKHKTLYYDNLMRVRTHHDMNQWLKFFLTGVIETAKKGIQTFDGILQLKKEIDDKVRQLKTGGKNASKVVAYLYQNPIINPQEVSKIIGKSPSTAYGLISQLKQCGIIREMTGSSRRRLFAFDAYIKLFE